MLIGYARVSTDDQNPDLQTDALKAAGCERLFTDKVSGTQSERPQLSKLLEQLRSGDTLVIWRLDRLGRSLPDLIKWVQYFDKAGVQLRSLRESLDTSSPTGKFMFHLFGALAEFERDLISERTRAGLKSAKARGRNGGRPQAMDEKQVQAALTLYGQGKTSQEICQLLGLKRSTFFKYVKQAGEKSKNPT